MKQITLAFHTCRHNIEPRNVLNFDKARFRVSVALGKEIVVPAYVKVVKVILVVLVVYYNYRRLKINYNS